uniref:TPM domain-containing protein n=3 Tax=Parascaris univalens TaxID=6257 RepID=A0A915A055_PARUN
MRGRFHVLLLLLAYIWLSEGSILSDYERCKKEGFGNTVLVCDADEVLANSTRAKLTTLLKDLQTRILCQCAKGCMRSSGSDKYLGVLLVTDSNKINDTAQPLNESAQRIYKDAELGNVDCQNGLLIIYIKDKQQLATYRGAGNFILLKSEDMSKLHNLATKSSSAGDDTLVLQYLLANYENVVMRSEIQRAETWTPMIGLSIALIIVLLILALLLALFLARFCCCCARSDKKEAYQVTTMPTYKTIEPLFIATSPHNERIHGPHSDVIYSTPYSGTPLPPPHFGAHRPEIYGGSVRSVSVSQSATPVSTHKHRIRPVHGAIPRGFTPTGTPTSRSRRDSQHVDDFTQDAIQTNGHSTPVDSARRVERNSAASITQAVVPRASQETASVQRSIGYAESDLSFLDPRRKLEVQTRTDYIY